MKRALKRCLILWLLLAMLPALPAFAKEGREITRDCKIKIPADRKNRAAITDRKFKTGWERYGERESWLKIELPKGLKQGGLYLCFGADPALLELYQGEQATPLHHLEGLPYAHVYLPFEGDELLSVRILGTKKGMMLSEVFVTEGEEPPAFVQRWQPQLEKADLLVLVAHPDDELLWMGGTLPYYSTVRGMDVAVGYMTCANHLRRAELLNGLWTAGIRHYPFIGTFQDARRQTVKRSYEIWHGEDAVDAYVTGLVRKLKPQVLLSHDVKGEYGHPAHIITATAAITAAEKAGDASFQPKSAKAFGVWDLPKLYLHIYPENSITMDWEQKSEALGGQSPLEVTLKAYAFHRSQQQNWAVAVDGKHSSARFGLVRSLVGPDIEKNDFFEHIALDQLTAGSQQR